MPRNRFSDLTALVLVLSFFLSSASASAFDTHWSTIPVGGGGFVTGMDVSPYSTGAARVVRTDTAGAYIWSDTQWQPLITAQSMPASAIGPLGGMGVQEIALAPSSEPNSIIYMEYWKYIYVSADSGNTWTQ